MGVRGFTEWPKFVLVKPEGSTMTNLIKVPHNYDQIDPNRSLPSEGEHAVKVADVTSESEVRARVQFQITEGEDAGMYVDQNYNTDHPYGVRAFKQLMETQEFVKAAE